MNGLPRGEESLRNNKMVWTWALGVVDLIKSMQEMKWKIIVKEK